MKKLFIALVGMAIALPSVFADTQYVSPFGNDTNDGASWASAKQTIQAGVDGVSSGGVVWVSNGVYATGGRVQSGYNLLTRVLATNGAIIRSVNGPLQTIIDGGGAPCGSSDSVRTVLVGFGSRLEGFTLIGGSTKKLADGVSSLWPNDDSGGGVFIGSQSVVSNCIIRQCAAANNGGGVFISQGGSLGITHCQIMSNSAVFGGGVSISSDATGGYVQNCVIQHNGAGKGGGGTIFHKGVIRNCLITDNVATNDGGGLHIDSGSTGGYVENCTITRNYSPVGGGIGYIIDGATVKNSIIFGNTDANWDGGAYSYSCLMPIAAGAGNITNDPLFVDSANGNFRLASGSPCINAGTNLAWATNAVDLDGNPRTIDGRVDMGAYEHSVTNPIIALTPAFFTNFITQGQNCSDNTYQFWNAGVGTLAYSSSSDAAWLTVSPVDGASTGEHDIVTITYNTMGLEAGSYTGVVSVLSSNANNSPQVITVIVTVSPCAPTGVAASDGTLTNKIRLTWNAVPGATMYEVFRSGTNLTETAASLSNTVNTVCDDTNIIADTTYYYWVKAKTGALASPFSASDSGWAAVSISLSVPTGVSASDGEFADKVRITWLQVTAATHYQVWRNSANNAGGAVQIAEIAGLNNTLYEDTSASADVLYYYWIRAKVVTVHGQEIFSEFSNSETGYARLRHPRWIPGWLSRLGWRLSRQGAGDL